MPSRNAARGPRGSESESKNTDNAAREERRRYKREFMRKWRKNPHHRLRESLQRTQWNYERKKRQATELPDHANARGEARCGICGKLPPVTEIVRLRVSECAPSGYVEVRFPYCGTC